MVNSHPVASAAALERDKKIVMMNPQVILKTQYDALGGLLHLLTCGRTNKASTNANICPQISA